MSHRGIGQERFGFSAQSRSSSSLEDLSGLIDRGPVAALLKPLYPATKGEPAWPPLAMFKAMLLAVWYDLSDVKLAEGLDDRASFRRFCGFSANEATPDAPPSCGFSSAVLARGGRPRIVATGMGDPMIVSEARASAKDHPLYRW